MWFYEEQVDGKPITHIINRTHVNVRYLPDINLGKNVRAELDLCIALRGAIAMAVVLPYHFLRKLLERMKTALGSG